MSGEHPEGRKAMADVQRRMVEAGVKPAEAAKKAREVALAADRKRDERK